MSRDTRRGFGRISVVLIALLVVAGSVPLVALADTEDSNDTKSGAESFSLGSQVTGSLDDGDEDWYEFTATRGQAIEVTATRPTSAAGSYFIALESDQRRVTSAFISPGETETIGITVEVSGTYYVEIDGDSGEYTFTVETFSTDGFEPNEGTGDAVPYTVGTTQTGQLTQNDQDYFSFTATRGQALEVTATRSSAAAESYFVGLENEAGNRVTSAFISPGETETIGITVEESGTYYVEIDGDSGEYEFSVVTEFTDAFEPNEGFTTATQLYDNPRDPITGVLRTGDEDWFRYAVETGEVINVTANRSSAASESYFLALYDDTDRRVASAFVSPGEVEDLGIVAERTGSYRLEIDGNSGRYGAVLLVDGEEVGLPNDQFEPNENLATAASIEPGTYGDLAMVDDDVDTFAVELEDGERLDASTALTGGDNILTLELVNAAGVVVARDGNATDADTESVTFVAPTAGTYYLRVTGEADAIGIYTLSAFVIGDVAVTVGPGADTLIPGGMFVYDVRVANVSPNVEAFDLVVRSSNTDAVVLTGATAGSGATQVQTAANGSFVRISVSETFSSDDDGAVVATVRGDAVAQGSASIGVTDQVVLRTSSGFTFPIEQEDLQGTAVTVTGGDGAAIAVEPASAPVPVGGSVTYDVVVSEWPIEASGVGGYDLTVNVSDTARARVVAVTSEIDGSARNSVAADGSGARLAAFGGNTGATAPITVATVTVEGVAAGDVDLSVTATSLSDETGTGVAIGTVTGATVTVREFVAPDVTGNGRVATDPDGDGLYEDVNGDGDATPGDATVLFNAVFEGNPAVTENVVLFDFNGDGGLTPGDATVLFNEIFG